MVVDEAEEGDNMRYRICKNKYDYYKIQKQRETKILGIVSRKKWENCGFYPETGELATFSTAEEAQVQIDIFIEDNDQQQNKDWTCVST